MTGSRSAEFMASALQSCTVKKKHIKPCMHVINFYFYLVSHSSHPIGTETASYPGVNIPGQIQYTLTCTVELISEAKPPVSGAS